MTFDRLKTRWPGTHGTGQEGSALVEYALLVTLIAVVCLLGINFLGGAADEGLSMAGSSFAGPR